MAKIIRFRRPRWTRARDYGAPEPALGFWPEHRPKRVTARGLVGDTIFWLRPVMLFAGILILWPALDAGLVEPPGWLSTEPELVSQTFVRCGQAPNAACVVDGDTFRLGKRRIRIVGIDTPEVKAQCPEEARLAEAATVRLQALLNDGEFEMLGRIDEPTDRYGRELKSLRRRQADGSYASIGARMREEGHARRYLGGLRGGWC